MNPLGENFPKGFKKRGRSSSKDKSDARQSSAKRPRKKEGKQVSNSKSKRADSLSLIALGDKSSDGKLGPMKHIGSFKTYLQGDARWEDFQIASGSTLRLVCEPGLDNDNSIAVYGPAEQRVGYLDARFGTVLVEYLDRGAMNLRGKADDPRPGYQTSPQTGLYVDILADPKWQSRILASLGRGIKQVD